MFIQKGNSQKKRMKKKVRNEQIIGQTWGYFSMIYEMKYPMKSIF